jgi:nucleoside-triphosphatase THEP1/SAM-dependent methyltransferase
MTRWALLLGPKGSSKAKLLERVIALLGAEGVRVGGFVQTPIESEGARVGYEIARVSGPERVRVARTGTPAAPSEDAFCSYVFDRDAFSTALGWLKSDLGRADVVAIDEVSKLESAGQGHAASLERVLEGDTLALLSVRADVLPLVVERFGLEDALATLSTDDPPEACAAFVRAIAGASRGGLRAGAVDWPARWAEMVRASSTSPPEADPWEKRAARFARMSRERPSEGLMAVLGPMLRPTDVIADVGAGAGRHVLELAPRVAHVVAVEPSRSMREHLVARLGEERVENVTVVAEAWPTPLGREPDVIFSSHVLYAVEDAARFLRAMAPRRLCALYLSPRPPSSALDEMWAAIHGKRRPRPPGALEALSLLWQLGKSAELRLVPDTEHLMRFADSGDDLIELCHRLAVDPDEAGKARVKDVLARLGHRGNDGVYQVGRIGPHLLLTWAP